MVVPEMESMFVVIAEVISPVISRGRLPLCWHFIIEKGRRTEQCWMNDLD